MSPKLLAAAFLCFTRSLAKDKIKEEEWTEKQESITGFKKEDFITTKMYETVKNSGILLLRNADRKRKEREA